MLKLTGHSASIIHVCKNGFFDLNPKFSREDQLKAVIAVGSGLRGPDSVLLADLLYLSCALHDELIANGLLKNPTAALLDSFRLQMTAAYPKPVTQVEGLGRPLLNAVLSNIANMRVREGELEPFVEWKSALTPKFNEDVRAMLARYAEQQSSANIAY